MLSECAVDSTFVVQHLGSQESEGLNRLKEICAGPFAVQVCCGNSLS